MELYDGKLYLFDSNLKECNSEIVSLVLNENNNLKYGTHKIILNQTIFHPQGGGQPSTVGIIKINNNNESNESNENSENNIFIVNYVQHSPHNTSSSPSSSSSSTPSSSTINNNTNNGSDETTNNNNNTDTNTNNNTSNNINHRNGCGIEHYGVFHENCDQSLFTIGANVTLVIDFEIRKLHMKLHSAGHVIDAAVRRLGYWNKLKAGKGYHFADGPYVEYNGELSEDELSNLQNLLNDQIKLIIEENIPSKFHLVTKEEASALCECDTSNYPDIVRVVEIAGHSCPCGGTHILSTIELSELKVTRIKKKKKNVKISYEVN